MLILSRLTEATHQPDETYCEQGNKYACHKITCPCVHTNIVLQLHICH